MSSFVLCVRDQDSPSDTFGGSVSTPTYLAVPDGEAIPRPSHALGGVRAWMDAIVAQAMPKPGGELDLVFFVHGYNTPPEEALKRQRLVETELRNRGFASMVVGFDWPTSGSVILYLRDRMNAQAAAAQLVAGGIIPFTKYNLPNCPVEIHLMAHSMGGFVVREAFRAIDLGRDANLANDWRLGQVVFFAADVSSECFAAGHPDMVPVFDHCGRLTNYFSGHDEALAVSNAKNLDISSRVGRVGMPADNPGNEKAVDVDCGPRYAAVPDRKFQTINGMTSHSWYLEDPVWYDDLAYTLKGQLDRNLIPTRTRAGDNDFVLKTGA
jgi:esterase/lipase superfamily enzyme